MLPLSIGSSLKEMLGLKSQKRVTCNLVLDLPVMKIMKPFHQKIFLRLTTTALCTICAVTRNAHVIFSALP